MKRADKRTSRRGTVLLMIVGLLAMLFILVSAYIVLARLDRHTLRLVGRGEQVTQIVDSLSDVAVSAIRGPGTSAEMVTGAAYADIPGYGGLDPADATPWGSPWLASSEPVRDPDTSSYGTALPQHYRLAGVTSFLGTGAANVSLTQLMLDGDQDNSIDITPGNPSNPGSLTADTLMNARQPFMDADGDGFADSHFSSVAVLTELANAMVGQPVRAGDIDPAALNSSAGDLNYLMWQHFDTLARYAVSAKIVSHGGMVQVAAPTDDLMWNSAFIGHVFNWVRHPNDGGSLDPYTYPSHRDLLVDMGASSGAVEPVLRRRGGLLAGWRGAEEAGLPPAMWTFQSLFRDTFRPRYDSGEKSDNWQRFNLASWYEWTAWRHAAAVDAEEFNDFFLGGGMGQNPRIVHVPRQLLTTVNNSDELARIQEVKPPGWTGLGLRPGQLKFYLGRIASAFDGNGHFDPVAGAQVVRELADSFYEMLRGHKGWRDDSPNTEAVTRREQAFMLAVNTVAFAAPRSVVTEGLIDVVAYTDPDPFGLYPKRYIGYAPQPFIAQVMAYRDPEDDVALAVEFYNPNDRTSDIDDHALYLPQFAISLNDAYEGSLYSLLQLRILSDDGVNVLNMPLRMDGRAFMTLIVNDNTENTYFETTLPNGPTTPIITNLPVTAVGVNNRITVKLWRAGAPGFADGEPAVLVDQFEVTRPADNPGQPNWEGSWFDAWRDTSAEPYFGIDQFVGGPRPARWRCPTEFPQDKPAGGSEPNYHWAEHDDSEPDARLVDLGAAGPEDGAFFGPCTPVYTMNAGLWPTNPIHGASRPASFPTVGFMLFTPRFSHIVLDPQGFPIHKAASRVMYEQWDQRDYGTNPFHADFAHMPVFDNSQEAVTSGQVPNFDVTDPIPWGLLVFDYFTTLNPNDANGNGTPGDPLDPYRVVGRINVNTAPWYVLAGLPVIGPDSSGDLPVPQTASPAFWSIESGILAGVGADGTYRYPSSGILDGSAATSGGEWYRLGPYLAQAAAAYRDRAKYVGPTSVFPDFEHAHWRNGGGLAYRQGRYGQLRGQGDDVQAGDPATWKRGFLSVGELANVMAFDGSEDILDPVLARGDFMKAASLLAMLDTHFLTTRSNTFTVYVTLTDRENPQASVRSQITVDRTNLLPRLILDPNNDGNFSDFTVLQNNGLPEFVGEREVSYFNARYDE